MDKITYNVAMEIASHEAIVRETYYDGGHVPTWSVGLTSATGHKVERYWHKPQSIDHCLRVYVWALNNYADEVRFMFSDYELTEEEFAAALSFHWNTGAIKKASWVKTFKSGNKKLARQQFMQYNKPASIIGRRTAEAELLFDHKWSNNGTTVEYQVDKNGQIIWKSAHRIDISRELKSALMDDIPASDKVVTEVAVPVPVETPVPVPVAVTPPSHDTPWYASKEVIAPALSTVSIGGVSTFMEKFGGIPMTNLFVLLGFITVALIAFLLYMKYRDGKAVDRKVDAINKS